MYKDDVFDSNFAITIIHETIEDIPTTEETLENLKLVSEVTQQPISDILIGVPEDADLNHYKELVCEFKGAVFNILVRFSLDTADELSANITKLNQALTGNADIQRISIFGCNMESDNPTDNSDSQYGRRMVEKLNQSNIKAPVAVRSSYVAVDENGKKLTSNTGSGNWMHKDSLKAVVAILLLLLLGVLVVLGFLSGVDSLGLTELANFVCCLSISFSFCLVTSVSALTLDCSKYNGKRLKQDLDNDTNPQDTGNQQTESDRREQSRVNAETEVTKQKLNDIDKQQTKFANSVNPKESTPLRNPNTTSTPSNNKSKIATTAFNIQINIGNGDHTTFFGGSTNVDVKVGNGGHYALMYGDNNIFVSIGDADNTDRFVAIGDYRALEGVQVLIGTKNVVVNHGIRNDLIIATDPSFPMIPFVNPFNGSANILGSLQDMADMSNSEQNALWSWEKTKKFATSMSALDATSDTDYKKILMSGGQNSVSDRGLKYDIEMTLNKKSNEFMQRESLRQQAKQSFKEKVSNFSLNLTIGGQGSDILIGNGNFSFMFGDTFSSVLDTTVASLFGIMQQGYTSDGQPKTTFTYTPANVKTKLINGILNGMASQAKDTTFGNILGYEYTNFGRIYKTATQSPDLSMSDLLKELLGTVSDTFSNSIQALSEPERIINALRTGTSSIEDMGKNTLDALGIQDKSEDDGNEETNQNTGNTGTDTDKNNTANQDDEESTAFGFSGLKLPSLFTLFTPNLIETLSNLPELAETLSNSISVCVCTCVLICFFVAVVFTLVLNSQCVQSIFPHVFY
jgi:hypothetical protein